MSQWRRHRKTTFPTSPRGPGPVIVPVARVTEGRWRCAADLLRVRRAAAEWHIGAGACNAVRERPSRSHDICMKHCLCL
ncbi:hypothetical protein GDO81_029418 [Engystomops pustulosus]|uniref:Uncharacterized protein n=1 Tax=Engystomops pustulosus TaxID=76066 RepID=A0AAV6YHN7_ENGPU|nr:hypothetical protein GDO81_029418 [Engystomops pustulosus]